jgi:signal transduction histidine kinase
LNARNVCKAVARAVSAAGNALSGHWRRLIHLRLVRIAPELERVRLRSRPLFHRSLRQAAGFADPHDRGSRRAHARDRIWSAGRDVTAEKEAVEALRKAQANQAQLQKIEALGQLTGGVAHDFNNLLMVIGGNIPRVRKSLIDDPKATRAAEAVEVAANRGKALTRHQARRQ